MAKGIRLKPMRRDIPARCQLCNTVVKLTARETRLVNVGQISHDCTAGKLVEEAPAHNVRGRFVVLV
jgi:hypothetical protein